MVRSKYLILITCCLICFSIKASYKQDIYNSFISNNMQKWHEVITEMSAVPTKSSEFRFELVNYQYGYIAWCIDMKKEKEAESVLKSAEHNLMILETDKRNESMIQAYKSAFYGYKIGLNKFTATTNGPKSVESVKKALLLDPSNAFAYCQYGNIEYYMPVIFGGSKITALKYYLKSNELIEKNMKSAIGDWNYLYVLTSIAESFYGLNNMAMAKYYCDKIIAIEPNYLWIRNTLYPKIKNKLK